MKKSPEKLIAYLEKFNKWRRGCAYQLQPHPKKVGDAIDQAVEMLKTMNKTSKEKIIELHTGKTVEEIEKNNRIVKTLVSWQPMETVLQDRKFFGVWGDNDGCALGYDVFEYIDGAYQSVNDSEWRMPMYSYKMLAWMEIPKYEP